MHLPFVSCIMPTANRSKFAELAVSHFLNQDYKSAELIIIDDGRESIAKLLPRDDRIKYFYTEPLGSIGNKRNYACNIAQGDIIVHLDDDDWYAKDWITKQVNILKSSRADICGLNEIYFFSPIVLSYWKYVDKNIKRPWLSGATMAYNKKFWEKHPFKDIHIGEDYDYLWNNGAKIYAHDYINGFCAVLHAGNTTLKPFEDARHKKHAYQWMDVQFEGKIQPKSLNNYE